MANFLVKNVPCGTTDSHNNVVKVMLLQVNRTNLSGTHMVIERFIHSPVNHPARLRARDRFSEFSGLETLDYLLLLCISYSLM